MAAELSPEGQRDLLTIIKWARAAEQRLQSGEDLPPLQRLEPDDDE